MLPVRVCKSTGQWSARDVMQVLFGGAFYSGGIYMRSHKWLLQQNKSIVEQFKGGPLFGSKDRIFDLAVTAPGHAGRIARSVKAKYGEDLNRLVETGIKWYMGIRRYGGKQHWYTITGAVKEIDDYYKSQIDRYIFVIPKI